jgi:hypothetical protein
MTWVAVGVAGAGLVSGIIGAGASEKASAQQVAAERAALAQQQSMFDTVQGNERPFVQAGTDAQRQLSYLLGTPGSQLNYDGTPYTSSAGGFGSLDKPFNIDTFRSLTPQYNFDLQQGGQGVLNNDSSGQGALSGAALKDLMSFNSNFANNSFDSAFANYTTQQNNIFSRLNSIATLGSNAGSNNATGASNFASSIGNTASSIGASQASGTIGAANALTGGLQSGANAFYGQNALNQILNGGSTVKYNYNPGSAPPPGWDQSGPGDPSLG